MSAERTASQLRAYPHAYVRAPIPLIVNITVRPAKAGIQRLGLYGVLS
jgi:hypothetical protein